MTEIPSNHPTGGDPRMVAAHDARAGHVVRIRHPPSGLAKA